MSEKSQYVIATALSIVAFLLLIVNFSLGVSNRSKNNEILNPPEELEMAQLTVNIYKRVVTLVADVSKRSKDEVLLATLENANIDVTNIKKTFNDNSSN